MERRSLLKAVGIGGIATIGAGFGITGSAAAAQLSFNIGSSSVRSDDGQVTAVLVDITGNITWDGFDDGANSVSIDLGAKKSEDSNYTSIDSISETADDDGSLTDSEGDDLAGVQSTGTNGFTFDFGQIDLTETGVFSDAYFSVSEDGKTVTISGDFQIDATVTTTAGDSYGATNSATLNLTNQNEAAEAGASASGDSTVAYAGDILDKDDQDTGDDAYLEFDFSRLDEGVVVMRQILDNYVPKISTVVPENKEKSAYEKHLNSPIAFDVDVDGDRDFQLGWQPRDGYPEFAYLNEDDGDGWKDATNRNGYSVSKNGNTIVWEVPASEFGVSGSGDTFRAGGNATAGGGEAYVDFASFDPTEMYDVTAP